MPKVQGQVGCGHMQELKIDRTLKDIIPPLTNEEYLLLEDSIVSEGCRDPIKVWKGLIIDGHNRFNICNAHDISFETITMEFESKTDALNWMIDNQLGRRNLNNAQRITLALKRKGLGINFGVPTLARDARQEIADELNVSKGNVSKVKKVIDEGTKKTKDDMLGGKTTINKAYEEVKPKKEKVPSIMPEPEIQDDRIPCPKCGGCGTIDRPKPILVVSRDTCPTCACTVWDGDKCGRCGFIREECITPASQEPIEKEE